MRGWKKLDVRAGSADAGRVGATTINCTLLHFNFTLYRMCVSIYIHTYAKCFFNVRVTTLWSRLDSLRMCERELFI
jgi:hypothetical protein